MNTIEALRRMKNRRSISLETMSREIGVSSRTLFRWLHKESKPSMMAVVRLEEYLKETK